MANNKPTHELSQSKAGGLALFLVAIFLLSAFIYSKNKSPDEVYVRADSEAGKEESKNQKVATNTPVAVLPLDKEAYDKKLALIANNPISLSTSTATSSIAKPSKWPVKTVYPNAGALLPFNRIVAYYGNFYSTKMGVLGEYPPDIMLAKLDEEVKKWRAADPSTPVVPAIHYIVAVAQADAGRDGDYLSQMPDEHIEKAISLAAKANGIVFLDIQIGQSNVAKEVRVLESFLKLPQVHLGIDPEFSMKPGQKPGDYIGTLDAKEINTAIQMLSKIVRDNNLPPKILVLHRFTEKMITNSKSITPTPEVQVVINMDGWGPPPLKTTIYRQVAAGEPVQFTGIKIFYKNDLRKPSTGLLTPKEILKFSPQPSYIQYQ